MFIESIKELVVFFFFELSNVYRLALTIISNAGNGPSSQPGTIINNMGYMSTFINTCRLIVIKINVQ